jgi:hypothetical protein
MTKTTTLALIVTVFLFSACKKDPTEPTCAKNMASISGAYKITAATYKASPTAAEIDFLNTLFPDACQRDDLYTFKNDGTYTILDVGTVCNPNNSDNGTWAVTGDNMQVDGDPTTIDGFDCKTLVIANTDIMTNGDRLKLTLTKQ